MVVPMIRKWMPLMAFLKLTCADVFGKRNMMFTIPLRTADP